MFILRCTRCVGLSERERSLPGLPKAHVCSFPRGERTLGNVLHGLNACLNACPSEQGAAGQQGLTESQHHLGGLRGKVTGAKLRIWASVIQPSLQ